MAQDYSGQACPLARRLALATTWTLITPPKGAASVRIEADASIVLYFGDSGVTDGGALGSNYATIAAGGTPLTVQLKADEEMQALAFGLAAASGTPTVGLLFDYEGA